MADAATSAAIFAPSRFPEARSNSDNSSIRVISIFPLQPALNCMNARAISDDHTPVAALVDPDRWISYAARVVKDVRLTEDGKSQSWDVADNHSMNVRLSKRCVGRHELDRSIQPVLLVPPRQPGFKMIVCIYRLPPPAFRVFLTRVSGRYPARVGC